jgi:predicted MFS family arabinose efflux permease
MTVLIPALSLAGFVVIAIMRVSDPLVPVLAQEFHVSAGQAGVVVTSFAIGYGLFLLLYGPLGDRYGKLRIIALTLMAAAFCVTACAFATSLPMLALWRFLTGVTTAATVPLSLAYIGDHVPLESRQATIARYMSGVIFGQMFGAGLGGILSDLIGWRAIFVVFGIAVSGIALMLWRLAQQEASLPLGPAISLAQTLRRYWALTRDPMAADLMTAAFIEGLCIFGSVAYIGALLHAKHHLSFTLIGLILIAYGLGGLCYSLTAGRMLQLLGRQGMVMFGGAVAAWSLINLTWLPVWWGAPPLIALLGLGFYMMHSTLQTLATELLPGARGTSFAIFAFALFAGQSIGVTLLGHLVDAYGYPLALGGAGVMVGLLGLWLRNSPAITRFGRG